MGAIDTSTPSTSGLRPLVVDLDGTLIRTDLAVESFFSLLAMHPLDAVAVLRHLFAGRACFKAALAERVWLDFHTLPLNDELVAWLAEEKAKGRRIYLASASMRSYVQAMADRLGFFDGVFGSDQTTNLAGAAKAKLLCDTFGEGGFDYVGNAAVDLDVWSQAGGVVVANAGRRLIAEVESRFPQAKVVAPRATGWRDYARVLRVHQWLKNLLLFVPAFAAHRLDASAVISCLSAFVSFSLCASSVYVLNDLVDLRSDRSHPSKRRRPFASGRVEMLHGLFLMPATLLASFAIGLFLPWKFLAVLCLYYAVTFGYSAYLKRKTTVDVVTLAALYGVRLVAGGAAVSVPLSPWLLTFALFLFFSLALVKRCSELMDLAAANAGDPSGRGYRVGDLPVLLTLAAASGNVAVLTFALYLNSAKVVELYSRPEGLWLVPGVLLYWVSRVLILTHRGEMHQDPVMFAAKDRISWICAGLVVAAVVASI